jgi:gamma-glutamyltranspeptidase/glutathione hydrolase
MSNKILDLHNILQQDEPKFQPFNSRRSVVYSNKGMISASQPLAVEAGLTILRKGGNALDAAIAVSAGLALTEPCSCGMGGDLFVLFYDAKTKKVSGLNGSGRSPAALNLLKAQELGITTKEIPLTNLNS